MILLPAVLLVLPGEIAGTAPGNCPMVEEEGVTVGSDEVVEAEEWGLTEWVLLRLGEMGLPIRDGGWSPSERPVAVVLLLAEVAVALRARREI